MPKHSKNVRHGHSGFAEGQSQPPLSGAPAAAPGKVVVPPYVPYTPPPRVRTKVGPGGRVVIPAAFRAAAGMEEGTEVVLTLHGKEVRVITSLAAMRQAQEDVMKLVPPGVSLVDELIADRRAEERAESEND